mgnify:CR=1
YHFYTVFLGSSYSLNSFLFFTPIDSLNPEASIPVGIAMAAIPIREVIDAIVFPTAVTGIESPYPTALTVV